MNELINCLLSLVGYYYEWQSINFSILSTKNLLKESATLASSDIRLSGVLMLIRSSVFGLTISLTILHISLSFSAFSIRLLFLWMVTFRIWQIALFLYYLYLAWSFGLSSWAQMKFSFWLSLSLSWFFSLRQ